MRELYNINSSINDKIAVIGNYTPRMCGIATFTADTCNAIASELGSEKVYAVAMDDRPEGYDYPDMVRLQLQAANKDEYINAAEFINYNSTKVAIVQHEYGIYGGVAGEYILDLMRDLHMPIITNMHTVLSEPNDDQRRVTQEIINLSARITVMSKYAKDILIKIYDIDANKVQMIPHGIPDVSFIDPNYYKEQFGVEGRKVILTFGLLSPGKGVEVTINAMEEIVKKHPDAVYICLGATHPHVKRDCGEEYRNSLIELVERKNLNNNVIFVDEFVSLSKLCEYIGVADVYTTSYHNPQQITSGTLAYALGAGKAIVSTPYIYAKELLDEGRGLLFDFGDHQAMAQHIVDLFDISTKRHSMRKKAYQYGRDMVWSNVANSYNKMIDEVFLERGRHPKPVYDKYSLPLEQVLPEIDLRHLYNMTDDTSIYQHAIFSTPNRNHGYCTDDTARALIVASDYYDFKGDKRIEVLVNRYMAFMFEALDEKSGRFRNFMGYNRNWLEKVGSEDSHGRAIWGLGVVSASTLNHDVVTLASRLMVKGLSAVDKFHSPRSWAFALLGIDAYLKKNSGDALVKRSRKEFAGKLYRLFKDHAKNKDWPWFEKTVTYANARISEALIRSGYALEDKDMLDTGLKSLRWLLDVQTGDQGQLSIIGNNGWYKRGGKGARFDQQPIEAGALIDACISAYNVTEEQIWVQEASRCFRWFLGYNDLQVSLYDISTGGCRDGLQAVGFNENQGAESTLVWLMSLLKMYSIPKDEYYSIDSTMIASKIDGLLI